jgi:hypothetical protein
MSVATLEHVGVEEQVSRGFEAVRGAIAENFCTAESAYERRVDECPRSGAA